MRSVPSVVAFMIRRVTHDHKCSWMVWHTVIASSIGCVSFEYSAISSSSIISRSNILLVCLAFGQSRHTPIDVSGMNLDDTDSLLRSCCGKAATVLGGGISLVI